MAKETVQAVRQVELKAASMEKEALQKKEAILFEARQNAKNIIATKSKEALLKAEQKAILANEQGTKMLETAKQKAEKEVLLMKEMVKSKETAVIQEILSNLI